MSDCKGRHIQCEDKRQVLFSLLQNSCRELPDYSAGDILYTVLRRFARQCGQSVSFLRTITDNELYEEADYMVAIECIENDIENIENERSRF